MIDLTNTDMVDVNLPGGVLFFIIKKLSETNRDVSVDGIYEKINELRDIGIITYTEYGDFVYDLDCLECVGWVKLNRRSCSITNAGNRMFELMKLPDTIETKFYSVF
jgi:hypothetical protein